MSDIVRIYTVTEILPGRVVDGRYIETCRTIVGVFSTQEEAEKMIDWLKEVTEGYYSPEERLYELGFYTINDLDSTKEKYLKRNFWILRR